MPRQAVDLLLRRPLMPSRKEQNDLGVRGSAAGVTQLGSCLAAVAAACGAPGVLEQPPVVAVGAHAGGVGATRSLA